MNVGYLLLSFSYGTLESFANIINYLVPYIVSTLAIFLVILLFRRVGTLRKIKFLGDYRYYFSYSTTLAVVIILIFFSLAGIPPLAGFFTKFFLFRTVFLLDFLTNFIIFVVIVTSVVSAFYYIRVIRFTFFYTTRSPLLFVSLDIIGVFVLVSIIFVLITFCYAQSLVLTTTLNLTGALVI